MYEIHATITDDYGTRVVPTGRGFYLETSAYDEMEVYKRAHPEDSFFVEYVPAPDYWHAY